jgi:hypothetical protein
MLDLKIRIFQKQDKGYPVEIVLDDQQEFPRGHLAADILPWVPGVDPQADGQKLFQTLFADDPLREAWAKAQGQAPQRRIRLRIDPAAAELHALPWELLHKEAMLSAHAATPFSRYLPIALPWGGPVEERPVRVLAVISDPDDIEDKYGLPPTDVALERETIESALENAGGAVEVDFLEPPVTPERLEEKLRENYHVLHYTGHGAFSEQLGKAVLYVQQEDGKTHLLYDHELASMLARQGVRPRLVFLSACQSASRPSTGSGRSPSGDAFLGMAPKLVSVGVPAVVAMQDFVTVDSALEFSATFYERLLAHGQVDLAVNEARSGLLTAQRRDAGVPVLFMRLKSGLLWSAEADARGKVLGSSQPLTFWTGLIRTIKEGNCTPILGPRIHGRWLPTPSEVACEWAKAHGYPFADKEELARVAQYMATHHGEDFPRCEFLNTLKTKLTTRLPERLQLDGRHETLTDLVQSVGWQELVSDDPNKPHKVLASLNLPLYLTTNPDGFLVEALKAEGRDPVREICHWNESLDRLSSRFAIEDTREIYEPTPDEPLVYQLFGSDKVFESLVLTEDDYLNFLVRVTAERDRIPNVIREALSSSKLMFIGYSLYDWEFRVLMHGLVASLDRRRRLKHVTVQLEFEEAGTADTSAVQSFLEKYFQDADINVFWGSPAQFVAELRERWEARQI